MASGSIVGTFVVATIDALNVATLVLIMLDEVVVSMVV